MLLLMKRNIFAARVNYYNMSMRKHPIILLSLIALFCCCGKTGTEQVLRDCDESQCDGSLDSLLSVIGVTQSSESLVCLVSDTVYSSNPELLLLLDTLYQHVRSDDFSYSARNEEEWMNSYRARICTYYDRHNKGVEGKSELEKVEEVLRESKCLIALDNDDSTIGMLVKNSVNVTFERLSEYSLLSLMISKCKCESTKKIVYKEWELFEDVRQAMTGIGYDLVRLRFWRGSAGIPLSSEQWLKSSNLRKKMYQQLLMTENNTSSDENANYKDDAVQFLIDHLTKVARDLYSEMKKEQLGAAPLMNEKEWTEYKELAKDTERDIVNIGFLLKEWIRQWDALASQLSCKETTYMTHMASNMLVDWSKVVFLE